LPLFLSILIGYLIGSIPTAYLFVRLKAGLDLRSHGSGNIGAFNAYNVTHSKKTGILVGVLDGIKGLIIPFIIGGIFGNSFWIQSTSLLAGIIGHNYPIWLRFHGGRGLSMAAGGFFVFGISYTTIWCLTWFISSKILKEVLHANLVAIVLTPLILMIVPTALISIFMIYDCTVTDYLLFSSMTSGLLFLSHLDAVKDLLIKNKYRYLNSTFLQRFLL
jgi:acyl phosphate:glycerol-3-phosphate acyltransferase